MCLTVVVLMLAVTAVLELDAHESCGCLAAMLLIAACPMLRFAGLMLTAAAAAAELTKVAAA